MGLPWSKPKPNVGAAPTKGKHDDDDDHDDHDDAAPIKSQLGPKVPTTRDPCATGPMKPEEPKPKPKTTGIGSSLTDEERKKILASISMQ